MPLNRPAVALGALATATAVMLILGVGDTHRTNTDDTAAVTIAHVTVCGPDAATGNDVVGGACYLPDEYNGAPTLDTVKYGTDIPRCASDDWNSTHLARCYTERVTDGAVLIIDATDTVIGTLR